MGGKRILLSLEIPDLQPWNEFSAIACVMMSIADVLYNDGNEVYINEYSFADIRYVREREVERHQSRPWFRVFPKRIREAVKDILLQVKLKKQRQRIFNNPRPDIIISWLSYSSKNGSLFKKHFDVPLIVIFDNFIFEEYETLHGFKPLFSTMLRNRERLMLDAADALIAYAPIIAEMLTDKYRVKPDIYIRSFVDSRKINILPSIEKPGKLTVLYIGSFFKWHKVSKLIEVFSDFAHRHSNTQLLLVGDGPELASIKRMVADSPVQNRIQFLGTMGKQDLVQVLQKSHIGVIPAAMWFHAPLKIFQYAAAGLVVLGQRTPVFEYLAKGYEDGIRLFDDYENLRDQLEFLQMNRSDISIFGKVAKRFIDENYLPENYSIYFRDMINQTIRKYG